MKSTVSPHKLVGFFQNLSPSLVNTARTHPRAKILSPLIHLSRWVVFFFFALKKISNFAFKMHNFARRKRQIFQKLCNIFTQPAFFLYNHANTAVVHPQSLIFFYLNIDHLQNNIHVTRPMEVGM